jgi:hypothetical protein
MSANPMPTEMQCLTGRLRDDATDVANDLGLMASHLAIGPFDANECGSWSATAGFLMERVRAMQFDAARLAVLADDQADDARRLYSQTMELVDGCRMARATWCPHDRPEVPPDPAVVALADFVEESLADMQEAIAAQFPGEKIPGG